METIKALFVIAFAVAITYAADAQQYNYKLDGSFTATATFKVNGVCEMCKNRIESSVKNLAGMWSANLDIDSKTLLVKYDKLKVNPGKIEATIANVGHDTEKIKATEEVYVKLPDCCYYARTK